jgi:GntR family transcriptional regulator / MocR family aminotransferase
MAHEGQFAGEAAPGGSRPSTSASGGCALDLLLPLERGNGAGRAPLHRQVERSLREAIREGRLVAGTPLPSTRALARELSVSRGVVFEAYAQLAAEGYLEARQGAATRVASRTAPAVPRARRAKVLDAPGEFDLLPGRPDLSLFPRATWLAAWRRALRQVPDRALGYPDPRGTTELRDALTAYLGRARAIAPDPQRTVVTAGVTQGLVLLCRVLRDLGHTTIAVEDPGFHLHRWSAQRAGLEPVPVAVDHEGVSVGALAASGAHVVLCTPAHQMPTGAVLSPVRRAELLAWAEEVDGVVIEDDYDAEYRFDREPVGALQGVDPERVVYAGSASKVLANALRLGWLVLPSWLARQVAWERIAADGGGAVLDQLALADLLGRGEIDRHLRRTRRVYRDRRDTLVAALGRELPGVSVTGIAAGLHALVLLPDGTDEDRVVAEGRARGVAFHGLSEMRVERRDGDAPGLVVGYAHLGESAIERAVAALAGAVRAAAG